MTELRDYQIEAIAQCDRTIASGERRVIVVAPTGSGKTIIAAAIIKAAVAEGKRVLALAHTREIIGQTSKKLYDHDIPHGVIQAGFPTRPGEPVQVASVQTMWSRAMRTNRMDLPPSDLLIIDEAHHCPARTYRKIIAGYPDAILLGLTATPCRGDGRGLGGIFETIVECPQVAELIDQKHLVRTRIFAPVDPDLRGVESRTGDYVESQLAERMDRAQLVGDIVTHWHRYGERRKTVCFAVNVQHSIHLRDEFIKSGVRAEHIDGATPKPDRDATLKRLQSGETELISNCMVLTEGWDMPEVSCAILARPTRKMGLFRQMVGRILRPAPGKVNAIVLDHSGAVFRHGFVEDHVEWTLDPEMRSESPTHAARLRDGYMSRLIECSQCGSIRMAGAACTHCGFLPQRAPRAVPFRDGDLALVDRKRRTAQQISDPDLRLRWHGMLTAIAAERGYQPGWIAHKFKEKFGTWPATRSMIAIEPTAEIRAWVRSRNIAWAKAKEAAARNRDKGRLAPFVPLLKETLSTPAWRSLSHGARSLYVALKMRYSQNFRNNGRLYLSQRNAAQELNSHHAQIGRWFRELQHFGFIEMMVPGHLGVEGRGKAPHWRLTELGYGAQPPTRDFDRWNGKPFAEKKLKPRAGFLARAVAENPHTSVAENPHTKNGKCGGKPAHKDGPRGVAENPHITSLTTSHLKKARQLGAGTRNVKHGRCPGH